MSREGRSSLRPLADAGGSSSRSTENGMVATDARERVPPVATTPPSSCVAREWTDFGKSVGRYDGEGAIATCTGGPQPVRLTPEAHCPPQPAHCQLPTANYPLPTAHCPLPTTHCQLPTANYQLPTTNYQLPTTNYLDKYAIISDLMQMIASQIPVILVWAVTAALLAYYAVSVASEITYVTLADGRKTERKLPLVFRLLLPFVPNLSRVVSLPSFASARDAAEWMIVACGLEGLLSGAEFVALKMLVPLVCGSAFAVAILSISAMAPDSFIAGNCVILILMGFLYFYAYPLLWLRKTLKRRHESIMLALPFVLDLLTLSVEAGMDFMSALQRNCERRRLDPLNEELIRMTREIQMGMARRVALRNMADRVRQPDLRSVSHALIQADELGVPIAPILRIQSEQLRSRRFDRAEKLANEAPVKMLGPLLLCIFPAVMIVLLAPILLEAVKNIM